MVPGPGGKIRTSAGINPTVLQTVPIDHSGTPGEFKYYNKKLYKNPRHKVGDFIFITLNSLSITH